MRMSDWSSDVCSSDLTLRADELARRIEPDAPQHRRVGGDLARPDAAADDDGIGVGREFERLLPVDRHAVHRGDLRRRRRDLRRPPLPAQPVQDRGGDEAVELVETVEGQNRDLHGEDSAEGKGRSLTTVGSDWNPRPEPIPPSSPAGTGAATDRCSQTAASRLQRSPPAPPATPRPPASLPRPPDP